MDNGLPPPAGPSVWLDVQRAGLKARHRYLVPVVRGAPTKRAVFLGLLATLVVYATAVLTLTDPWAAAIPSTVVGFFSPFVGAYIYELFRSSCGWWRTNRKDLSVRSECVALLPLAYS